MSEESMMNALQNVLRLTLYPFKDGMIHYMAYRLTIQLGLKPLPNVVV